MILSGCGCGATTDIINTWSSQQTPKPTCTKKNYQKNVKDFSFINCLPLSDHYCNGRLRAGEEMDTFNLME